LIQRRVFLKTLAATLFAAGALPLPGRAGPASRPAWLSALADGAGGYSFAGLSADGAPAFDVALPARGHSAALHPVRPVCVVFARRPGTFALAVDWETGVVLHRIDSRPDRHFYGHGVFSADGGTLFATENDFAGRRGVIGIFDADAGYQRIGEFPSHGVGPHDIRLLEDERTLVIANGGIETHPDAGREKLNLDDMQASLAYVDTADGHLRGGWRLSPEWNRLSIRHLALGQDGAVVVAMQFEGPPGETAPLICLHRGEDDLRLLEAPDDIALRMRNYAGSAAVDAAGRIAAVSAPRGNLVTFWRVADGEFIGSTDVPDGCGVAATGVPDEFALSSGLSGVMLHNAVTGLQRRLPSPFADAVHWDNHLIPLPSRRGI
jgi:uncharacterized protein